jgi:pyruvate carboxylase
VTVRDRAAAITVPQRPKADAANPCHVAAPMPGRVASVVAQPGRAVKRGERLLSIESMKMETAIYSPRDGTVEDVLVRPGSTVETRDLVVVLREQS